MIPKPSSDTVPRFLEAQCQRGYSNKAVGANAKTPPEDYFVDRYQGNLGEGLGSFFANHLSAYKNLMTSHGMPS